ncbi:hypothetical protein F2Q70_00037273 [Brassica cretica]|uniref:Ornithine aminotransferase n=2 Tax=Brassica cretica TaxID=69181 RepID=A0A8S9JZE2_BRACR|nr:hypothetical protein F2Q70_00037273 [Brassica cretica]
MSGKGAKGLIMGKSSGNDKDKDKKKPTTRSSRAGLQLNRAEDNGWLEKREESIVPKEITEVIAQTWNTHVMVLPMNTGAEGVETALKIARKWGHEKKNILKDELILMTQSFEKIFKEKGDKIAGFLFKPVQGEAGVVIPPEGYLKIVRELCTKYNVLMIADEVQ